MSVRATVPALSGLMMDRSLQILGLIDHAPGTRSSIDLENVAVAHPGVAEAAAIGIPHPTWSERPILFVVPKAGHAIDRETVLAFLDGKVAKWWLPDDVILIAELPHTATGKISKRTLRERHAAAFA